MQHSTLPEAELHEPKGVSTAAVNKVYVANGSGSGTWQKVGDAQMDYAPVNAGATLSVTVALHAGRIVMLDTLTGSICTLPIATGSGAVFKFVVKTLATSNSHVIKVANGSGLLRGVASSIDTDTGDAVASWGTTVTSDTITLNRSTTGSVYIGEEFILTDVATNVYSVSGWFAATGAPATPFSATV